LTIADIKDSIKHHSAILKKHEEHKKAHEALLKKANADIKKQKTLQIKASREIHRAQLRIEKTNDFLKSSHFMLDKLVFDNEHENASFLIRDNENAIARFSQVILESNRFILDSKSYIANAMIKLKRSHDILKKLEDNLALSDDEHLFIVGGKDSPVFKNIDAIRPFLGTQPKYHIIRTSHTFHHTITIRNFKKRFIHSVFLSDVDMDILLVKPEKHTFLFIKEKLRCAKTLHKEHLGVLYERITENPKIDIIVQGLVGRLTGYHRNLNSVVFSNPDLVRQYHQLWLQHFHLSSSNRILLGSKF
jgi:hypothetical protein